jgi:hypothetical protein
VGHKLRGLFKRENITQTVDRHTFVFISLFISLFQNNTYLRVHDDDDDSLSLLLSPCSSTLRRTFSPLLFLLLLIVIKRKRERKGLLLCTSVIDSN